MPCWRASSLSPQIRRRVQMDQRLAIYGLMAQILAGVLQSMYNECLLQRDVPDMWLTSSLVGVLKKNRSWRLPESYRVVGLESCLLKGLTWLMDRRIRGWAEVARILPACQNGFQPGLRTNNNSFVLLSAIHTYHARGQPLYVVLVDLQNAFPLVNQEVLWKKLWDMGVRGPIFDVVRAIYRNMRYVVRLREECSEAFTSNVGILAGDPGSPLFWILYAVDCVFSDHPDDVQLQGKAVPALFHTDDLGLMSNSIGGAQHHLDELLAWCALNALQVCSYKSKGLCSVLAEAVCPSQNCLWGQRECRSMRSTPGMLA
jgi:hypothetical protein